MKLLNSLLLSSLVVADLELDSNIQVPTYDHYRLQGIVHPKAYKVDLKPWLDPADQGGKCLTNPDACKDDPQHFDGVSQMIFEVSEATKLLVIHSRYLVFDKMVLTQKTGFGRSTPIALNMVEDIENEWIRIGLKEDLKPNTEYTLDTEYIGFLKPNNHGLYISEYVDPEGNKHYVGSTQFQGPYARRTFPCLDEPSYKATFETTLWHQNNYPWSSAENEYYTISNMPPKNNFPKQEQDGWWKTEFEPTVKMSTYLKAFAIVDFGSVHHKSPITNTDHELFARTELIGEKDQADTDIDTTNVMWFPMECTGRTTDMLGHMLGVEYPGMGVDKADQIALPDFDAGAMENWGLVTYREQSLLFDMNRDRFSRKSYVCTTVSHEMAHMWFGDYVTCQWWDELWLNEAFATYFAWVGVEPSEKDSLQWKDETGVATWDLDHDLITGRMTAALNADQTVSSNPIINIENRADNAPPVKDHRNYGSSSIIYSKGGVVLNMVRCALGDTVFFGGLNKYLDAHQYDSVTSDMLFKAWDDYISSEKIDVKANWTSTEGSMCGSLGKNTNQALLPNGASVADVVGTWTRQMGYPFIRVNTDGKTLKVQQDRFLNNPNEDRTKPTSNLDYNWYVPLHISTGETFESLWMMNNKDEQTFDLSGLSSDPAYVVVNHDYRSLVRVLYENDAKFNIQGQLASDVNSVNEKSRAQMVFDYFAFAENDALTGVKVTDALEFTEFASRDTDKTVWDLYARGISYIRSIMKHTDDKAVLDKYLQEIIATFYSKNNWDMDVTKINDMERTAMSLSLIEACKYGTADCLVKASEKFTAFDTTTNANELDRDQKLAGYCYGIQEGSADQWDALWKLYEREQNANEKSTLTYGLACSKDTAILKKYMQYGIDTVRVQDKHTVFNYVSGSDYGRDISWQFIQDNWNWFYDM